MYVFGRLQTTLATSLRNPKEYVAHSLSTQSMLSSSSAPSLRSSSSSSYSASWYSSSTSSSTTASPASLVEWACERCTLLNPGHVSFCSVCSAKRPAVPPPTSSPSSS